MTNPSCPLWTHGLAGLCLVLDLACDSEGLQDKASQLCGIASNCYLSYLPLCYVPTMFNATTVPSYQGFDMMVRWFAGKVQHLALHISSSSNSFHLQCLVKEKGSNDIWDRLKFLPQLGYINWKLFAEKLLLSWHISTFPQPAKHCLC